MAAERQEWHDWDWCLDICSRSEKSAQVRKEFKKRTSGSSYRNVDIFILESLAENGRNFIYRVQISFAFNFEFRRNSVNGERHLSEIKRAQFQYVDESVESSHLEEVEI